MSKQHAIFFIGLFLTMTMGAFQNCSKDMSFGSNDAGQIIAFDIDPNLGDGGGGVIVDDDIINNDDDMNYDDDQSNNNDNNSDDNNSDDNTDNNNTDDNNSDYNPIIVDNGSDDDGDDCDKKNTNACKDREDDNDNNGGLEVICILDGPGKSVRAGYTNAGIEAVGSTPRTICTSQDGCLAIHEVRGDLKSIESPRGYCKNNSADTVQMSEAQIRAYYSSSL